MCTCSQGGTRAGVRSAAKPEDKAEDRRSVYADVTLRPSDERSDHVAILSLEKTRSSTYYALAVPSLYIHVHVRSTVLS